MKRGGRLVTAAIALTTALAGLLAASASASATRDPYASTCLLSATEQGDGCPGFPTLKVTFVAGIVPERLPKHELASAALDLRAKIATTDGTHPSALREVTIDFARNVLVDAEGLPVCHPFRQHRGEGLRKACRSASIGGGRADIEYAFPGERPIMAPTKLIAYNGGVREGVTTVFVVAFVKTPAPAEIIIPVTVAQKPAHGLQAVAKLPVIASGRGSLIDFRLRVKRSFKYKRQRKSLVSARCPDGAFRVQFPKLLFRNEAGEPGIPAQTVFRGSQTVPCKSNG